MSASIDRSLAATADDPIREQAARDYFGSGYIPLGAAAGDHPMHGPNVAFRGGWVAAMQERNRRSVQDLAALDYAETALSEAWAVLRRIRDGDDDPQRMAADLLDAHGFAT